MDSIKWKCKNWIVYFKKFDNFHFIYLIVEKLDVFNFHPTYSIDIPNFTLTCEIWIRFLTNIHQSANITETKNKTERFLVYLNIKMSAKSNQIELSEEFMVLWREEQTLWDIVFTLYWDKNKKDKSYRSSHRRCSVKRCS